MLYVNMREPAVRVLGPGRRYALWVSGCCRNCPGCISPESHDMKSGTPIPASALAWEIIAAPDIEGITISGGEPFLQAAALSRMLKTVKNRRDLGVIIYTGFLIEELRSPAVPHAEELLELCDLLIDGPYIRELDDGQALRGSGNQRVLDLSGRYSESLHLYGAGERQTEIFSRFTEVHKVGIPTDSVYHPANIINKSKEN